MQLTVKQEKFVEHYIHTGNGTEAARLAGYKGNATTLGSVASENLQKPDVRREIQARRDEFRLASAITTEAKRETLWHIAQECLGRNQIVEVREYVDDEGVRCRDRVIIQGVFDGATSIKAIQELNRMDGDYAAPADTKAKTMGIESFLRQLEI